MVESEKGVEVESGHSLAPALLLLNQVSSTVGKYALALETRTVLIISCTTNGLQSLRYKIMTEEKTGARHWSRIKILSSLILHIQCLHTTTSPATTFLDTPVRALHQVRQAAMCRSVPEHIASHV